MIGELEQGAVFHPLTLISKRAKSPIKSVSYAKVLSASTAADEGTILKQAYNKLLGIDVGFTIVVDTKDLYDTISTKRLPTDKTIKGDVSSLRYDFEVSVINRIIWLPGKFNIADPLTKRNSPIEKSLQLTMFTGLLSTCLEDCLINDSKKLIG